jgi:hypothetical protein
VLLGATATAASSCYFSLLRRHRGEEHGSEGELAGVGVTGAKEEGLAGVTTWGKEQTRCGGGTGRYSVAVAPACSRMAARRGRCSGAATGVCSRKAVLLLELALIFL